MKLELNNEFQNFKNDEVNIDEILSDNLNNLDDTKNENNLLNLTSELNKNISKDSKELSDKGIDKTIGDVTKTLEFNIEKEIQKLKLDESVFQKFSKSKLMDVVKVAIEAVLKGVLKKKFGINYSTFNDMKNAINDVMDGNLKDALKQSSDVAVDNIKILDGTTRTTIKTVKNAVIDKTIDSEKYEIVNKQTKILNRISKNCEEFNEALKINDSEIIKKRATSIKNDMQKILPIRETIVQAQCVLDKYALWQNKGNKELTIEENELIEKLNKSA